jgi:hypothetical protein
MMSVETWCTVGTIVGTLVLLILPGLVYTWYALEHMIGDKENYAPVVTEIDPSTRPPSR